MERLLVLVYRAGWALVRALPERVAARLFERGADLAWHRQGKGARRLRSNLARVVPEGTNLDRLGRDAMRSYARYWLECFRLPVLSHERIVGRMHIREEHNLRDAHAAGKGTILALPHMGNWDHAGAWLVLTGVPFTTVAERLKPAELFDLFVAFREGLGFEVLAASGAERPPFEVLSDRLRAGGMLCLLADRDLTPSGVPVTFFGARATMPAGPAALALRTGAALIPTTLWYSGDAVTGAWEARTEAAIPHTDIPRMTQALADRFAAAIAAHPADWHMLQRLWTDDLDTSARPGESAPADASADTPRPETASSISSGM
jgi:phosphatidylinositol dimannoside acyltransferase